VSRVSVACCSDHSSIKQTTATTGCLAAKEGTSLSKNSKYQNSRKIYLFLEFNCMLSENVIKWLTDTQFDLAASNICARNSSALTENDSNESE